MSTKKTVQQNVMLDLETLGKKPGSAIASIAAAIFDIETGKVSEQFYVNIDWDSCFDYGLKADGSTLAWWFQQSNEARMALLKDQITLPEALIALSAFIPENAIIWGNGPSFDLAISAVAYEKVGLELPWKHYNEKCVRTIVDKNPAIKKELNKRRTSVAHYAHADVLHQIDYLVKTDQSLVVVDPEWL